MHRIAQLNAIEQQAHHLTPAQRLALRHQKAVPALADLHVGCWPRSAPLPPVAARPRPSGMLEALAGAAALR